MFAKYDRIGLNYSNLRQPDKRIADRIHAALGKARSVLNVGAGTGSYEPPHRDLTAIEPSAKMIDQRKNSDATVVQGNAEDLPFDDNTFDASMAVLTIHHWTDQEKGVQEMARVTRDKVVFLTYDPSFRDFWLYDYFPELIVLDEGQMPKLTRYEEWLGKTKVSKVLIPHDCTDGFLAGYWRRPTAYLDERVRAAMSSFWALGDASIGLAKLSADLKSGAWERNYGYLLNRVEQDCGYRLVETV